MWALLKNQFHDLGGKIIEGIKQHRVILSAGLGSFMIATISKDDTPELALFGHWAYDVPFSDIDYL